MDFWEVVLNKNCSLNFIFLLICNLKYIKYGLEFYNVEVK